MAFLFFERATSPSTRMWLMSGWRWQVGVIFNKWSRKVIYPWRNENIPLFASIILEVRSKPRGITSEMRRFSHQKEASAARCSEQLWWRTICYLPGVRAPAETKHAVIKKTPPTWRSADNKLLNAPLGGSPSPSTNSTLKLKGRAHLALHGGAEQKEQDGGKQLHLHRDGGAVEMVTTVTANTLVVFL